MGSLAVASRSFSNNAVLQKAILSRYPDAKFNDKGLVFNRELLIDFLKGHEKAIISLEKIDREVLAALPELKVISKYGVGLDSLDLQAMREYGVKLGWEGGVNKRSVAELVVSFSIALLHRSVFATEEVKNGRWYQIKGRQLMGCTVGIIGCGHIGKDVVRLLQPFHCKILAHDIIDYSNFYKQHQVIPVGLEDLLRASDVVTLHVPLDDSTRNILNRERLQLLKSNAVLLNLARGGLLDERFLKEMLLSKKLAGAALDVLEVEPPTDGVDLARMENVIVTPHIGGSTEEAVLAMGIAAIKGLEQPRDPLDHLVRREICTTLD